MHVIKASADKKLLGNCQAAQIIVLTGSYRQKTYKLLELYRMSSPPPESCICVVQMLPYAFLTMQNAKGSAASILDFEILISQQLVQAFTKSTVRAGLQWTEINAMLVSKNYLDSTQLEDQALIICGIKHELPRVLNVTA